MQLGQTVGGFQSPFRFRKGSGAHLILVTCLVTFVVLTGFLIEISSAEEEVENEKGPFDCHHLMLRAGKRLMKVFSKCGREIKANCTDNKEFGEKLGCVMKCVMRRVNMLTPESLISDESLKRLMVQFLPNDYVIHEVHTFIVSMCRETANKIDPDEDKCLTYANYVMCLQSSFEEFMNISPICIKKKKKGE